MKLIINRITAEFNKIFTGAKRVGDSLKLEGKRMSQLDVSNSATLGYKTESTLNVNHSVWSDKSITLQSYDINGDPVVNASGDPVYIKENQFRVSNSQFLRDVAPINLEVDIARRLKVGDQANSPIINVSSLITHPTLYRVKDSGLLGGKLESELYVLRAKDADNADLLNDTLQKDLVVEKARISTHIISDIDGAEMDESKLRVSSAEFIRKGTTNLNIYQMRDYFFSTQEARDVYVTLSASSNTLTTASGNKSFVDIIAYIKDDSSVEAYKAKRIITAEGIKTGDEYKTWLIAHNDFKAKVATLNAATADRAVRFGDASDNVTITEMDARIKGTTVDLAANSNKLQNVTVEDIISTTRTRVLSDASNSSTGLTQGEVDGFFGNNKVKTAIKDIQVKKADDSVLLEGYTRTQIKDQVKSEGAVQSAKYIYANPTTGGLKSYLDITADILAAKTALIDGAASEYMTLGRTEDVIKANKTAIETSLATEVTNRTTADNNLQSHIDVEKARIDTILDGADADKNTFSELRAYVDSLTGNLTTTTTDIGNGSLNVVNITNALEARLINFESSSTSSAANTSNEVDAIEASVGLKTNGGLNNITGNFIGGATTVLNAITKLDDALLAEQTNRSAGDTVLLGKVNDNTTAITTEETRAKGVEGPLSSLTTSIKTNLVASINSLKDALDTESTTRTNNDDALDTKIGNNTTAIQNEATRAKGVEGTLSTLKTTSKDNLVAAINANFDSISAEYTRATTKEGELLTAINTVAGNLTTETTNRTTADTTLQNNINTVAGNLSTETTNRTNADSALQGNIDGVQDNLDTEASTRATNDATLQSNINTEKGRIDKVVLGLGFTNIDTAGAVVISGTNYIDSQTTISGALSKLDYYIDYNFKNLDTRVTNLGTDVTTETTNRTNADSTLQDNIDAATDRVTTLETTVSGLSNYDDSAVTSRLDTLETSTIMSLSGTDLTFIDGNSDTQMVITDLNIAGAVSDLGSVTKTALDVFLGSAKNDASYTDIGGPNNTVAKISTYLTTSTSFFESDILLDASLKSVDDRVTTLETTVSGLSNYDDSAVNGRLDTLESAGYLTTETDHGTVVLGTDTITNSTDGIGLAISSTNAKTRIDGYTIESSVPTNAVFTDTVYDDSAVTGRLDTLESAGYLTTETTTTLTLTDNTLTFTDETGTANEIDLSALSGSGSSGTTIDDTTASDTTVYSSNKVESLIASVSVGGSGDMLRSTYDTTDSGIVDNAELVNGLTVETAVPADAVFTDTVYDDSAVTGRLDVLESAGYITGVSVTYTTQEAEIIDGTTAYTFAGALTHTNTLVFSAGLKLRKQDSIYTLTDNGDDTTTLTVVDTTKFTVGEFIEIETITVA